MIFADKLIRLRKKSGMSQEEFAEKMNVSRQAVSKWESAQSIPDLERILKIADMFGVTTDYLLKDEIEEEVFSEKDHFEKTKKITLEQANEYLALRKKAAPRIALATFMCIVSVIPLLMLAGAAEYGKLNISEEFAGGLGIIILLIIVAGAVGIFLHIDFQNSPYKFLDSEPFEAAYGVSGMVSEQQKTYRSTYVRSNVIGVCLCILSAVPFFAAVTTGNEFLIVVFLNVLIFIVGIAVCFFVTAGVRWASMQRLLKEGDFTDKQKERGNINRTVAVIYWPVVVAIFLVWLFLEDVPENGDSRSWIVFPVAGVLFAAVLGVVNLIKKRRE